MADRLRTLRPGVKLGLLQRIHRALGELGLPGPPTKRDCRQAQRLTVGQRRPHEPAGLELGKVLAGKERAGGCRLPEQERRPSTSEAGVFWIERMD